MSKLQEIKQALVDRKERPVANHRHLNEWSVFSDMEWLISQLEQAQARTTSLESDVSTVRSNHEKSSELWHKACEGYRAENEQLKADNQQLIEALEWYADDTNHKEDQEGYKDFSRYEFDAGERARQTLSEVKGNE